MIAALPQTQSRQSRALVRAPQSRRQLTLCEQMSRQYWSIASRRRVLLNVAACFRLQPAMWPLQCTAAIQQLDALRSRVRQMERFLTSLEPATTQRLRPHACLCKLETLALLLTETILTVSMFAPICQSVTPQRVQLHLDIQSLVGRLLTVFEDTVSQLVTLMSQERIASGGK